MERAERNRLYRALEYFTIGDRNAWTTVFNAATPGVPQPSTGGAKPGMININTVWAQEVFNAARRSAATGQFLPAE